MVFTMSQVAINLIGFVIFKSKFPKQVQLLKLLSQILARQIYPFLKRYLFPYLSFYSVFHSHMLTYELSPSLCPLSSSFLSFLIFFPFHSFFLHMFISFYLCSLRSFACYMFKYNIFTQTNAFSLSLSHTHTHASARARILILSTFLS